MTYRNLIKFFEQKDDVFWNDSSKKKKAKMLNRSVKQKRKVKRKIGSIWGKTKRVSRSRKKGHTGTAVLNGIKYVGWRKWFDYRNVYLMEEKNDRAKDWFKRKDEKIGIGINAEKRRTQILRGMNGRGLEVVFYLPVFFAESLEQSLHKRYQHKHKIKRSYKSGKTEFFNLNTLNRLYVRLAIIKTFVLQWVTIAATIYLLIQFIFNL